MEIEEWVNENLGAINNLYLSFIRIFDKTLKENFNKVVDWSEYKNFRDFCNFIYEVSIVTG